MIDPVAFTFFGRDIRWYGIFLAAGFAAGLFHLARRERKEGFEPGFASDLMFWIMVGGILGARAAFVFSNWSEFAGRPLEILRMDKGGLVFYGGFFGAGLAIWLVARVKRLSPVHLIEYVLTALPLGHALGRLGCFINGCCHGAVHHGFPSCSYPFHSDPWYTHFYAGLISEKAPLSLPVWPVQLFEAAGNFAIFFVLLAFTRRKHPRGAVIALYFLLYASLRFFLEFFRGDKADRIVFHGLTSAQWVSLALFAAALTLAYVLRLRQRHAQLHHPA